MSTPRQRGEQLVLDGRVRIHHQVLDRIVATCQSTSNPGYWYRVVWEPSGWRCACVAGLHRRRCSHVEAVILEVTRRGRQQRANPGLRGREPEKKSLKTPLSAWGKHE